MAYFPPLPGFPLYDDSQGVDYILKRIKDDMKNLQDGGVNCIMFCNENDRPYKLKTDYTSVAVIGRTIGEKSAGRLQCRLGWIFFGVR